jgi:hypothetical protein
MEFIITDKAKGSREEVKGVTKDEVSEIQLEELEVSQTHTTLLSTHRRKTKKEN